MLQLEIVKTQNLKELVLLMTMLEGNAELEKSVRIGYNISRRFFIYVILFKLRKFTVFFGFELIFLVLKDDNLVCGGVLLPIWSINRRHVNIANVVIREEMRGKGLGNLLIKETLKFLYKYNINTVILSTDTKNIAGYAMYKKNGFIEGDFIYVIESTYQIEVPSDAVKIDTLKDLIIFGFLFGETQNTYMINSYKIICQKTSGKYYTFVYCSNEKNFNEILRYLSNKRALDITNIDKYIVMQKNGWNLA